MAHNGVLYFHNDRGVAEIRVGAKEFKCIGAKPPLDHPHIFLDMGSDNEIICPYCATLFKFDAALKHDTAEPADCVHMELTPTSAV